MTKLSDKDNLIIQTYVSIMLLLELHTNNFTNSEYFNSMHFSGLAVKETIRKIGIGNQGVLLMLLYGLLVLPKELDLLSEYPADFKNVNDFIHKRATDVYTNYKRDLSNIDFLYHIRNAVAHSKITMEGINFSIKDQNINKKSTEFFSCKISIEEIGNVIQLLLNLFLKYIKKLQENQIN